MAARSKSSQRGCGNISQIPTLKKAQPRALRSRAAYKLEELLDATAC